MTCWLRRWIVVSGVAMLCLPTMAQDYDFDWATITHPGNPAYNGDDPQGLVAGRGSVDYVYRISKWEVTTAQWMEYVNTFSTQSDDARHFGRPLLWGAVTDPDYDGPGRRWKLNESLPWAADVAVVANTWYEYAQFTNWLHNGKQSTLESLETGAYDSSTWGRKNGQLTDDPTHLPGAKFWIPTLDEWLKAAYWDPDGNGQGEDRWWMYPNMTDEPVPPDETTAGQGAIELFLQFPLGMFPDTQSPWGLIDLSGGTHEWLEELLLVDDPRERGTKGAWVGSDPDFELWDRIYAMSTSPPDSGGVSYGARIASIPAPSTGALMFGALVFGGRRRRRWVQLSAVAALCSASLAQDYDFDWATITHPGNPAYEGEDPDGVVGGRGSVDYIYRISKWEVTTAQWLEYINMFSTKSEKTRNFGRPFYWGGVIDPEYDGPGHRWKLNESLPWAADVAVVGNSWYDFAQFTNWLHNGKQDTWESLETGAYDSSTWGRKDGELTDDPTHLLGAKFWIPTLDEWLKAAYWDPDGNGQGEDRWWMYPNMTDEPVPPDETTAGHGNKGSESFLQHPLGSFPDTQSPWGLIDLSGGTHEWLEQIWLLDDPRDRLLKGSFVSLPPDFELFDRIYITSSSEPDSRGVSEGVRIASIPTPSTVVLMVSAAIFSGGRRTRR